MGRGAREMVLDVVNKFRCRNSGSGIYKLTSFTLTHSSLLRRGFKDFLVSSYANALDDKHFSSNAGDAIRGARRNEIPRK